MEVVQEFWSFLWNSSERVYFSHVHAYNIPSMRTHHDFMTGVMTAAWVSVRLWFGNSFLPSNAFDTLSSPFRSFPPFPLFTQQIVSCYVIINIPYSIMDALPFFQKYKIQVLHRSSHTQSLSLSLSLTTLTPLHSPLTPSSPPLLSLFSVPFFSTYVAATLARCVVCVGNDLFVFPRVFCDKQR